MSAIDRPSPAFLLQLQAEFSAMLLTPPSKLTAHDAAFTTVADKLRVPVNRSVASGLSLYHRQYWMRLQSVMTQELPLCRWLLGAAAFERLSVAYLQAHPPSSFDLHHVIEQLTSFVDALGPARRRALGLPDDVSKETLNDACALDTTYGQVFLAPRAIPIEPWPSDGTKLKGRSLPLASHAALFSERQPLVRMRKAVLAGLEDRSQARLGPAQGSRDWLLLGGYEGVSALPLPAAHATLLRLLQQTPLTEALPRLLAAYPEQAAIELTRSVQRWLSDDTRLGIFRDQPRKASASKP